nr:glycosyltransferase family 9 protein [Ktedonobacteraceae bacterium]
LLTLGARNCVRAGYTLVPELYDIPLSFHPKRGQIEGNLDIVRRLGHDAPFSEPRIFFSQEDAEHATALLPDLAQNPDRPRIAFVTQNSGGQPNRWSDERFQQVITQLTQKTNAIPIFFGTSADASAINTLRQALSHTGVSLAGRTTIPQLAAALAQCDLVISLDTGTFHVARAVELPGVVIAPAWQSPLEWLPVDHPQYRVLRGPSIAAPPPDYWIEEVTVEQVINAATDMLNSFPPDAAARAARIRRSLAPNTLRQ